MPILNSVNLVNSKMEMLFKQGEVSSASIYKHHRGIHSLSPLTENLV
jgi:hypothetical protein